MLCPFYRYIDKRAAYALPPEILTYGDIFYISVPVPIFSQFNFSDAFIVLVVKIYYLISIVNIFKAICLLILFILFVLVGLATADARPNLHYDLINPADGRNYGCPEKGWRYDRNTMNRLIQEGRIIWPDNPDGRPRKKSFLNELSDNLPGFSSVFSTGVYTNTATKEIGGLFNKYLFDFPKPVEVIKQLVSQVSNTDDIILDFFSGSATTAHAVMQLNAEDGGNRRFILVQLPELCDEKSEAYKTGYKNICEIGKERIRRAGKMLKDALESSGLFVRAMKRHQDQHDSLEGFAYAEWEESPEVINAKKEMNEDDITIPDDIKNLPDIKGWGNVYSLHAAMALDETGTLKSLVEQYLAATDDNTKDTLLNDIIYHWAGVQDMDPVGRNPSRVYGNVLGDARKLEALEEFMGEDYLGTWCWGERETNPHGHAAPMILQAFELLKNYVGTILSANLANNPYLQKIILTYNAETKHWDVNVDQAVALLQEAFEADATNGKIEMLQLSNILRFYDNAEDVIAAFQAKGSADGTFFETELLNFGHNSVGSAANDNLFGTEGNDLMDGLAGNDIIKAAEGDDTVLGGSGNDYIYGEDGDDVLDGEEGNDYLFGGNGNDTLKGGAGDDVLSGGNGADIYLFEKGFGNDSIDNTQDDMAPNADIIKFGEGILPENAILQRQGFDLIISVSYEDGTTDSVRVFSYFDKQGTSSTTVSAIQFADGTSWDYEYVLDHWNSLPDINGGVTLEGNG